MAGQLERWLAGLTGVVLWLGPRDFRVHYGPSLVGSFATMLGDERARRGVGPMLVLWMRGVFDAFRAVGREQRLARKNEWHPFSDIRGDLRGAIRRSKASPGFSLTVIVSMIVGLATSSAIFAFADGYLFRGLPFPDADRLYFVREPGAFADTLKASDTIALRSSTLASLGFVEWGGTVPVQASELVINERRIAVRAEAVSPDFAQVVQMPFEMGRPFAESDIGLTTGAPAWMSYDFWQRELGGDRSVLNRTFSVSGPIGRPGTITVVGILGRHVTAFDLNNPPPDFVFVSVAQRNPRPNVLSFPIVRLPATMTSTQAEAAIGAVLQAAAPASPGSTRTVKLRSLYQYQTSGGRPTAVVFLTAAGLLVLLVAINLVHLFLTRSVARSAEVATRLALGASRWRVARIFLVESLVLGSAGVAGGLALGWWLARLIASSLPRFPTGPRNLSLVAMTFDTRVVIVATGLGLVVALFGGFWPAWRAARRATAPGHRKATSTEVSSRTSKVIVGSAVMIATAIMCGTAFMALGIWRYLNAPLGFELAGRLNVSLIGPAPPGSPVNWPDLMDALRRTSGVRGATVAPTNASPVSIEGRSINPSDASGEAVAKDYFVAWGIPLREGRSFTDGEIGSNAPVAMVDEKFARAMWPDRSAVGQFVRAGDDRRREIIGIVAHERRRLSIELAGVVYVPRPSLGRREYVTVWAPGLSADDLVQRLSGPLQSLAPGARALVTPVTFETTFLRDAGEALFQRPIVSAFGLCAFVLAGIGLFGLVAYLVERRTRDFGIRLALGAASSDIWRLVAWQSVAPALAGLAGGLAVSALLERLVRATVFGWQSSGLAAAAIVGVALMTVAFLAAVVPARRALGIDPIDVLRSE